MARLNDQTVPEARQHPPRAVMSKQTVSDEAALSCRDQTPARAIEPSAVGEEFPPPESCVNGANATDESAVFHRDTFRSRYTRQRNFETGLGDLTFDAAGSFEYFCAVHPSMRGRVIVTG